MARCWKLKTLKCVVCEKTHLWHHEMSGGHKPKTCRSEECMKALKNPTKPKKEHLCKGCGISFFPKDKRHATYCSRECAFNNDLHYNRPKKPKPKPYRDPCKVLARRLRPLLRVSHKAYIKGVSDCKKCGKVLIHEGNGKKAKYCKPCKKDAVRQSNRKWKRKHDSHYARAISKGCEAEIVRRKDVYERDKYICHICGRKTDPEDYKRDYQGTYLAGPRHPSLDHIIPISKGGPHIKENLACACMECNSRKSDRALSLV